MPQLFRNKNQQLRYENQQLQAENQAAKDREIAEREDRSRRDQDRLNRLMLLRECSPSRTKKQTFPQEIIDQFFDHLYDDWEMLRTCALVCRACVPSSRYHLFGVVTIHLYEVEQPNRYSGLIGHLDHPLCTFAPSVRELHIHASTDPGNLSDHWLDPLIPYLSKLVSVKTLVGVSFGGLPHNHCRRLFKSTSFVNQITHLCLRYSEFESFKHCMETIHSFPSLESLECLDGYQYKPDEDVYNGDECTLPVTFPPPPSLHILETSFHNYGCWWPIWQWLHLSQTRLSIINLASHIIYEVGAAKLSVLNQYVQFLGPSLEILKTDFETASTISIFVDNVDLTLNTGLRVLELGILIDFYIEELQEQSLFFFKDEFSSFPLLLSKFSKNLTFVKFNIRPETWIPFGTLLPAETTNTTEIWTSIDELLSGPFFPALTKVAFYISGPTGGFKMTEYLESRMSRCKGRGLFFTSFEWY